MTLMESRRKCPLHSFSQFDINSADSFVEILFSFRFFFKHRPLYFLILIPRLETIKNIREDLDSD